VPRFGRDPDERDVGLRKKNARDPTIFALSPAGHLTSQLAPERSVVSSLESLHVRPTSGRKILTGWIRGTVGRSCVAEDCGSPSQRPLAPSFYLERENADKTRKQGKMRERNLLAVFCALSAPLFALPGARGELCSPPLSPVF
jgi:hypothetical protein